MFNMISSRVFASALRAQAPALQAVKARPAARIFQQTRGLKNTPKLREPVPRIRTLRKIPPELIPIGVVLAVAIGFAGYSLIRKLFTDGTLRLYRSRGHNQASSPSDTKPSH
ncbi:hypothetical protein D6C90_10252 [Aureobasidium pullulans]|uniref:NADH-ubiquinone reductase complex 1 MLRQ subunit n=1 Tax=Aureobasidium pullulans TaxID=5580 RepID=A0A4S9SS35_AURPU|nr:hypothetical protein D6D15_07364 [Aureobasidium pullulans]THX56861.1 hypothetical protein D6D06_04031 [Aureobasidium pullulans]THY37610.1 hypothetical protein D6C99_09565 [Aureobasidium pullulans]THZ13846.1 hypothetical protein D6C90_10252 [Aureobasidium pullulans]